MAHTNWEPFRLKIASLYIQENKTLRDVMTYMQSKYGFKKTKAQYELVFKKWGLKKRLMNADKWKLVAYKAEKRKRELGKDTELLIDGVHYPQEKVRKETSRSGYLTAADKVSSVSSPETPEGLIVFTPGSHESYGAPGMESPRDISLPWLEFLASIETQMHQETTSPALSFMALFNQTTSFLSPGSTSSMIEALRGIVSVNGSIQNRRSRARTVSILNLLMPEEVEGQHRKTIEVLYSPKPQILEYLKIQMFLVSNSFLLSNHINQTLQSRLLEHDNRLIKSVRGSGLINVQNIQFLISMSTATTGAIMEQLFASAVRLKDLRVMDIMLRAGEDPNLPDTFFWLTPLQAAAQLVDVELALKMTKLLPPYKPDVNKSRRNNTPLISSIRRQNTKLVALLINNGAQITPCCLSTAVMHDSIDIVRLCIIAGADVNSREWTGETPLCTAVRHGKYDVVEFLILSGAHVNLPQYRRDTPLCIAVRKQDIELVKLLLLKGAHVNVVSFITFNHNPAVTTLLGIATQSNNRQIVELLLMHRANINPKIENTTYIAPLVLATGIPDTVIMQLLLDAGADVVSADNTGAMTLIERAAAENSTQVCRLLIAHGAKVNRTPRNEPYQCSALFVAVKAGNSDICRLLLDCGARPSDTYSQRPGTALGAAMEVGNIEIIQMLLASGARFVGRKSHNIGNLETAKFLAVNGLLRDILAKRGPETFAAAAFQSDSNELTEYLLDYIKTQFADPTFLCEYSDGFTMTPLGAAIFTGNSPLFRFIMSRRTGVTEYEVTMAVWKSWQSKSSNFLCELLGLFQGSAATAVDMAVKRNDLEMVKLLLKAGVDPRDCPMSFDRYGSRVLQRFGPQLSSRVCESVLDRAAQTHNRKMLLNLLNSAHWPSSSTGRALAIALSHEFYDLADDFIGAGADLYHVFENYEYSDGEYSGSPIQIAVEKQEIHLVQRLLSAGADINYPSQGRFKRTALQRAVEYGNIDLVELLLDSGAEVNGVVAEYGGASPLQLASIHGFLGIARKLVSHGSEINAWPAFSGRSALESAAENGRIDMLQYLLNEGALVTGNGEWQYYRAVTFATNNGHYAAARLLRQRKEDANTADDESNTNDIVYSIEEDDLTLF